MLEIDGPHWCPATLPKRLSLHLNDALVKIQSKLEKVPLVTLKVF